MKLVITRPTYFAGQPVKAGDVVDADEPHLSHLLSASAAREATPDDLAPPEAPPAQEIETAEAPPAQENAATRPAARRK